MKTKFEQKPKALQRIAVAKDVIKRINADQYIAYSGSFICAVDLYGEDSVKKYVKSGKRCEVCAKGGLFMSYVGYVNKFDMFEAELQGTHMKDDSMVKLAQLFTPLQLAMIESAFEGKEYIWNVNISRENCRKCINFYDKHEHDKDRLLAICENIVKNKGTFKP